MEVRGIGCLGEHEERLRKKLSDCLDASDSSVARLVQHELDRLLICGTGRFAVNPAIKLTSSTNTKSSSPTE